MRAERYLVGLIGAGIAGSLTPLLHEREADRLGVRYLYQLMDLHDLGLRPEAIGDLISQAQRLGFTGLNVTHPCKQLAVGHLDELSPDAQVLGAVNTIVFRDGRRIGHNTDWSGFAASMTRGLPDARMSDVVLLGAGGAGTAVGYALLKKGAQRLTIVDVADGRAERLRDVLSAAAAPGQVVVAARPAGLGARLADADGLVNATAVGMTPDTRTPVPAELLHPKLWVTDIVYRPLQTPLLADARAVGCRTLDGSGMTVYQAVDALRLFTGRDPDAERMLQHMQRLIGGRSDD